MNRQHFDPPIWQAGDFRPVRKTYDRFGPIERVEPYSKRALLNLFGALTGTCAGQGRHVVAATISALMLRSIIARAAAPRSESMCATASLGTITE